MGVKKSLVTIFIEFFKPQDLTELEENIRKLARYGMFPPFATLIVMCDHKNMKPIPYKDFKTKSPLVIKEGDIDVSTS